MPKDTKRTPPGQTSSKRPSCPRSPPPAAAARPVKAVRNDDDDGDDDDTKRQKTTTSTQSRQQRRERGAKQTTSAVKPETDGDEHGDERPSTTHSMRPMAKSRVRNDGDVAPPDSTPTGKRRIKQQQQQSNARSGGKVSKKAKREGGGDQSIDPDDYEEGSHEHMTACIMQKCQEELDRLDASVKGGAMVHDGDEDDVDVADNDDGSGFKIKLRTWSDEDRETPTPTHQQPTPTPASAIVQASVVQAGRQAHKQSLADMCSDDPQSWSVEQFYAMVTGREKSDTTLPDFVTVHKSSDRERIKFFLHSFKRTLELVRTTPWKYHSYNLLPGQVLCALLISQPFSTSRTCKVSISDAEVAKRTGKHCRNTGFSGTENSDKENRFGGLKMLHLPPSCGKSAIAFCAQLRHLCLQSRATWLKNNWYNRYQAEFTMNPLKQLCEGERETVFKRVLIVWSPPTLLDQWELHAGEAIQGCRKMFSEMKRSNPVEYEKEFTQIELFVGTKADPMYDLKKAEFEKLVVVVVDSSNVDVHHRLRKYPNFVVAGAIHDELNMESAPATHQPEPMVLCRHVLQATLAAFSDSRFKSDHPLRKALGGGMYVPPSKIEEAISNSQYGSVELALNQAAAMHCWSVPQFAVDATAKDALRRMADGLMTMNLRVCSRTYSHRVFRTSSIMSLAEVLRDYLHVKLLSGNEAFFRDRVQHALAAEFACNTAGNETSPIMTWECVQRKLGNFYTHCESTMFSGVNAQAKTRAILANEVRIISQSVAGWSHENENNIADYVTCQPIKPSGLCLFACCSVLFSARTVEHMLRGAERAPLESGATTRQVVCIACGKQMAPPDKQTRERIAEMAKNQTNEGMSTRTQITRALEWLPESMGGNAIVAETADPTSAATTPPSQAVATATASTTKTTLEDMRSQLERCMHEVKAVSAERCAPPIAVTRALEIVLKQNENARVLILGQFGKTTERDRFGLTRLLQMITKKLGVPTSRIFDLDVVAKDQNGIERAKRAFESSNYNVHGGMHIFVINTSSESKTAQGLDLIATTHIFDIASQQRGARDEHLQLQGLCRAFRMDPRYSRRTYRPRYPGIFYVVED